jgi:hypothetical protein
MRLADRLLTDVSSSNAMLTAEKAAAEINQNKLL